MLAAATSDDAAPAGRLTATTNAVGLSCPSSSPG